MAYRRTDPARLSWVPEETAAVLMRCWSCRRRQHGHSEPVSSRQQQQQQQRPGGFQRSSLRYWWWDRRGDEEEEDAERRRAGNSGPMGNAESGNSDASSSGKRRPSATSSRREPSRSRAPRRMSEQVRPRRPPQEQQGADSRFAAAYAFLACSASYSIQIKSNHFLFNIVLRDVGSTDKKPSHGRLDWVRTPSGN